MQGWLMQTTSIAAGIALASLFARFFGLVGIG